MGKDKRKYKSKIAIIGTAVGSLRDCPFERDDWELWALSERPETVNRYTAWFELHNLERKKQKSAGYWQQLRNMTETPAFVAHGHPELPHAQLFPKDVICQRFGTYFTNTVAWLVAYAMLDDPEEIGLWGVDIAQDSEYQHQRPSCEYYIGWAMGRCEALGRPKITIPPESDLVKARRLYGFDDAGDRMASKVAARNQELGERLNLQTQQFEEFQRAGNMLMGQINELSHVLGNGCADEQKDILSSRIDELKNELQSVLAQRQQADRNVHMIRRAQENQHWVKQGF